MVSAASILSVFSCDVSAPNFKTKVDVNVKLNFEI